ncbi:hypothetical protein SETIT_9G274400v2 [Setaria italica]|uniref:X8 domain-containing protein n=1 Tax=Setaria italica TaxID=4555 RepID=K4ABY4_SETIT|nr:sulfated surface glycoprotein 185 isoform X1 [Setaria italica]RCV43179.1 hypothetical protein SETIT_9G274400v2 [Setaria italica]
MEFLLLFLVSGSLLLPSLGLAVSGQEARQLVHLNGPSQTGVHVSVARKDLPMVASSVLGAESWLRTHVLAQYPSEHITAIVVGRGVTCNHGQELLRLRLLHAVKNLHHSLVRWGLVDDIKVTSASPVCARDRAVLQRRLYGRHHLPATFRPPQPPVASTYMPPPPGVALSFAPNYPPEVVPSVPPTAAVPPHSPAVPASPPSMVSASPPLTMPSTPPTSIPASPPEVTGGMAPSATPPPCLAPPTAAMSPPPWSGEGGNSGGLWCVAKPTVPEDKLQEAMDYACSQDGVDCQEIAAGGSCFYPDNIASHASYAFNSYWQKMKQIGGSCNFGGTALLINSDPSYLQCRFMLS